MANKVAKQIIRVGKRMGVPRRDIVTALATGLVESNLTNPSGGHGTSAGWRQEISSYGSVAKRRNVKGAAKRFYNELKSAPAGSVGNRAQAVQRSAFPDRYAERVGEARAILAGTKVGAGGGGGGRASTKRVTSKTPAVGLKETPAGREAILNFIQNRDEPGAVLDFVKEKKSLTSPAQTETKEIKIKGEKGKKTKATQDDVPGKKIHGDAIEIGNKVAKKFGLTVTSTTGGNHVAGSYHYQGRAVDIGGSPQAMLRARRYLAKRLPRHKLTELFYDGAGSYFDNGKRIKGQFGGHGDHIHLAI